MIIVVFLFISKDSKYNKIFNLIFDREDVALVSLLPDPGLLISYNTKILYTAAEKTWPATSLQTGNQRQSLNTNIYKYEK